jgi:O-antigen/teichoic acid export membrane protein
MVGEKVLGSYLKRSCYNTFVYSFTSIFSKIISFFLLPFVLSRLTLAEFGLFDFYQSFFSLSALVLSSCAATSLTRFSLHFEGDDLKVKQVIGNSFLLVLLSVVAFVCFYIVLVLYLPSIRMHQYLHITIINISLFVLFFHVISYVRAKEFLAPYVILFLSQNLIATLLTVIGIYCNWGIVSFFYGTALSLIIFLPLFFYLLVRYRYFSLSLLREQIIFSVPLLIFSCIHNSFFTIDRFCISSTLGCEHLGLYGLLWRFGQIFQFFSIALVNASHIAFFSAEKEKNHILFSKMIFYYCTAVVVMNLGVLVGSLLLLDLFFSLEYQYLKVYIPLFFVSIGFFEVARIVQIGFNLAMKNHFVPSVGFCVLLCQAIFLYMGSFVGFWGILCANFFIFFMYTVISFFLLDYAFFHGFIDKKKTGFLLLIFSSFATILQYGIVYNISSLYLGLFLVVAFPLVFAFGPGLYPEDRVLIRFHFVQIEDFFRRIFNKIVESSRIVHRFFFNRAVDSSNCVKQFGQHCYSNSIYDQSIVSIGTYTAVSTHIVEHLYNVEKKLKYQNNKVFIFDRNAQSCFYIVFLARLAIFLYKNPSSKILYHVADKHRIGEFFVVTSCRIFKKQDLFLIYYASVNFCNIRLTFTQSIRILLPYVNRIVFVQKIPDQKYIGMDILGGVPYVIEQPLIVIERDQIPIKEKCD